MLNNKYKYGLIDESWLRSRNAFAIKNRNETYDAMDIVKMTLQSIVKFTRDYGCTCDRFILVQDKWSPDVKGYYRTSMINAKGGNYKGDRRYMTEELLEEIRCSPDSTEEDIKKAEDEFYFNKQSRRAKWIINNEFQSLGLGSFALSGWEFDDIVSYYSLGPAMKDSKKSLIITKDSDLIWSISPMCDLYQPPMSGRPGKFTEYAEAYENLPEKFRGKLSLYQYHAMIDSTGAVGHNNCARTIKAGKNVDEAVEEAMNNDFSNFTDKDLFVQQYRSFDIWKFPGADEAERVTTSFEKIPGYLGNLEKFHEFCNKYKLEGISERYFSDFSRRFDPNLYDNSNN